MIRLLVRAAAISLVALAIAFGQAPRVVGGFNVNGASLLEVIDSLAKELHIHYILDSNVKGGTVTVNTYGAAQDVDLMSLLETVLRMNNLAMVPAGNIYRIVPIASVSHQPISPVTQSDPSKINEDERLMLNLVFLRYMTSTEMSNILKPFIGEGGQISSYDPANLLIILDNSRNMKRTLELVAMFDSDSFAGQRVRPFEVKNGRPSDLARELEEIFKAYSFSGGKDHGALQFLPIDRINTILAVSPNPGVFTEVEKWLAKLDIPAKVMAGAVDNHVYKLKYGRAEILGAVIMQLYGMPPSYGGGYGNVYGGVPGNSQYPANGYPGGGGGGFGSPYGGGGGGYGSPYGGSPYGGSPYGGSPYGGGAGYGSPYGNGGGYGMPQGNPMARLAAPQGAATGGGAAAGAGAATTTGAADQTGSYLGDQPYNGGMLPRIVPNPFDNTLLVQGTPTQWQQIERLLGELDVSPRQVLIDAKIYEINLTGELSAGVETFLQKGDALPAGVRGHQLTGTLSTAASSALTLSAGAMVGHSRQLLGLLQANELSTKAKVLSAPSVIATDSIPASITVGDSVPTLSSQAVNPGVTSGGNSLFTNTISNTSTGVGLNILARVNPSGVVTMVIAQNVTAPVPTTSSSINSPSFSQRNVSTQVTVQDGDTIAIGGIIDEKSTQTSQGFPVLSRIPYLGFAFGSKSSTKQRTELIVFLTPHVIYDTNQIADATEELKQKVRSLRKMMKE